MVYLFEYWVTDLSVYLLINIPHLHSPYIKYMYELFQYIQVFSCIFIIFFIFFRRRIILLKIEKNFLFTLFCVANIYIGYIYCLWHIFIYYSNINKLQSLIGKLLKQVATFKLLIKAAGRDVWIIIKNLANLFGSFCLRINLVEIELIVIYLYVSIYNLNNMSLCALMRKYIDD